MRAFLAFDISRDIVQPLSEVQRELKTTGADVSMVDEMNLHFTVKFLGEVPDDSADEIDRRMASLKLETCEVMMRGVGVFPDSRRPRVVWVGVDPTDEPAITRTATQVINALEGLGKSDERHFLPHVTIGRVRSPRNLEGLAAFVNKNSSRKIGKTRIAALKLKSSQLTPSGPIYSDIREYILS